MTMSKSSPLRKSQLLGTLERSCLSSFLLDDRNTEGSHRDALAAAQAEHARVREAAIRVYELHELKEEHNRILAQERREQERLRAEAAIAAEEKRLQELRAKSIPKPPPKLEPERGQESNPETESTPKPVELRQPVPAVPVPVPALAPAPTEVEKAGSLAPSSSSSSLHAKPQPLASTNHVTQPKSSSPDRSPSAASKEQQPATQGQASQQPKAVLDPTSDRYVQIHQALKQLRNDLVAASKTAASPLKGKIGSIRREIRVSVGQLTGGKGANAQPTNKIMGLLRQSLDGQLPSPPVDAGRFVATARDASDKDVPNNGTHLPSLFIYLLNVISKGIINQFINECGANPKAADPIGVFTAQIFSHKDFSWRGQSMIDILIAKYRIVCPVLFGSRGNDKTEKGRRALGWKKDGPSWIPEQNHNDRMAGLGAGFASISLRDFSRASKTNPYPPTNYWKALACIVNCPPADISNTHLVVLRSMIDGHEHRFLIFYGNAAMAALRLALVEFPKKAPANSSAAGSLRALADILRTERGLALASA